MGHLKNLIIANIIMSELKNGASPEDLIMLTNDNLNLSEAIEEINSIVQLHSLWSQLIF